jgi:hypothetical protein
MERSFHKFTLPHFPGLWVALGPGIIWMAFAQGSGELIWWPYLIAKYGLFFLWLAFVSRKLAWACLKASFRPGKSSTKTPLAKRKKRTDHIIPRHV